MTALRVSAASDILAGAGAREEGMEPSAGELFWGWPRIVLAVGYGLVFLAGLTILLAADPNGLILMLAAATGVAFIHRTWLGIVVWIYVLLAGLVAIGSHDDLGFYGVLAGLGFGLLALPIWKRRPPALRPAYYWQPPQSPFAAPATMPALTPLPVVDPIRDPASAPEEEGTLGQEPPPRIRTVGRIQILTTSGDITAGLMGKPVVGFLWLYLMARSVRTPGDRLTRASITDEVAHGVTDPRGRLRGYLRDLSRLPEPLGSMVKVDDEMIGFELGDQDADFARLKSLAFRVRQANGTLDKDLVSQGQALLSDLGDGDFLPGFEDMEKRVTQGRGVAGQLVAEVRVQIDGMRADVAVAVATALLDRGQAALAVSLLEPIVARSHERDDLARTLINALRDSGQHARAAEIRRRFAAGSEN